MDVPDQNIYCMYVCMYVCSVSVYSERERERVMCFCNSTKHMRLKFETISCKQSYLPCRFKEFLEYFQISVSNTGNWEIPMPSQTSMNPNGSWNNREILVNFLVGHLIRWRNVSFTFSETLLLLPFSSSGAIHGRVPLTPPDTKVFRLIFERPKSATWNRWHAHSKPYIS